jgi:hypothetical protein
VGGVRKRKRNSCRDIYSVVDVYFFDRFVVVFCFD